MSPTENGCVLCADTRRVGLLCVACAARLTAKAPLLPHHIEGLGQPSHGAASAVVIDSWGRPHVLDEHSVIGREGATLRLLTNVVSRTHIAIARSADGAWWAHDLGSHNGSSLNGTPLTRTPRVLTSKDVLHLADVGLAFIAGTLPAFEDAPALRTQTLAASANARDVFDFALHENPMGGGGVLELRDGRTFDLPLLQLELLQLLTSEWQRNPDVSSEVRGFVGSAYLMSVLSWDAHNPGADHLKQLVRRTRLQLAGSGIGIEARRGAGYRLGIEPERSAELDATPIASDE